MFFTGVVILQTNQSFGIGKNNSRLLKFHSLDGKVKGLISTRLHLRYTRNQFVTVNSVDNFRDSRVKFVLHTHHGQVDDISAYISALMSHFKLTKKTIKPFHMKLDEDKEWENYFPKNDNVVAYSIDPEGCEDMDDAISFGENVVGVHITYIGHQLTKYISKMRNYTSIYPESQKVIHMLPDIYSNDIFSLKQKKYRNVISMYIEKESVIWKLEKIKIRKNLTYDNFSTKEDNIKMANDIIKAHRSEWCFNNSKEMIESFALLYNKYAASVLIHKKYVPIIREQETPNETDIMCPALYNFYHPASFHYSLNEKFYGHFTSPIRRMVDIYNQHLLATYLTNESIPLPIMKYLPKMKELNATITNTKKMRSAEFMYMLYSKDTLSSIKVDVKRIDLSNMCVWVDEWKKYVYISYVPYFLDNNWNYAVQMKDRKVCVVYVNVEKERFIINEDDELIIRVIKESDPYPRVMLIPDFLLVETQDQEIEEIPSPKGIAGLGGLFEDLHASFGGYK